MRRLPPLAAIRAFEAAARTENFTAAAAELGMTQAAVSYQVKSLEERLGAPLFVREKGRARLTPLGSRLLPASDERVRYDRSRVRQHREEDESLLTVTTTHTFANTWLAWRLGAFQMEHTDLAVRMTTSNELVRPSRRRRGCCDPRRRRRLGRDWTSPAVRIPASRRWPARIASPTVERKLGRKLEPNDVPDQNLINPADDWWQQWFADNGVPADEAVLRRRAGIRLENQANEGHAAMAGQGFALLTPLAVERRRRRGTAVRAVPRPHLDARLGLLARLSDASGRLAPKIKRFREWLLAEMQRSKADAAGGWPQPRRSPRNKLPGAGGRPAIGLLGQPSWPDPDTSSVIETPFDAALSERYLVYALSTITARSLPDVRDGLKPVHRRLLWAMRLLRLDPAGAYKKSARVVGDVIGKYHPHGDQSVYDAMVRLAQDFALRYPLVDGQGNFGNIDGDNAAAYRYTEARLTAVAMQLMAGLDEGTVDFRPTYNGEEEEPEVFPGLFPNLLANGASGIAVGMATSIPPHNVGELIDAAAHLIDNPKAEDRALMDFVAGPDFPTGGVLVDSRDSIAQAYVDRPRQRSASAPGSRSSARRAAAGTCWSAKSPTASRRRS